MIHHEESGPNSVAIEGVCTAGDGGRGVRGEANPGPNGGPTTGVEAKATGEFAFGVKAVGDTVGVHGFGTKWHGVEGFSKSTVGGVGVYGHNEGGTGVLGESKTAYNAGVFGNHKGSTGWGVRGDAANGTGVSGSSKTGFGVVGDTGEAGVQVPPENRTAGVYGVFNGEGYGCGVLGESKGGANGPAILGRGMFAGLFEGLVIVRGNVSVSGDLTGRVDGSQMSLQFLWNELQALRRRVDVLEGR